MLNVLHVTGTSVEELRPRERSTEVILKAINQKFEMLREEIRNTPQGGKSSLPLKGKRRRESDHQVG